MPNLVCGAEHGIICRWFVLESLFFSAGAVAVADRVAGWAKGWEGGEASAKEREELCRVDQVT